MLRRINRDGVTMVHVTHDYEEAAALATRVGVMEAGTIVQTGAPGDVFRRPASPFVARFVGIRNVWPGRLVCEEGRSVVRCGALSFAILGEGPPGEGHLLVDGEDVVLSEARPESSARNVFEGTVVDVFPARFGVEVTVDVGLELAALLTRESVEAMGIRPGARVWASVKASAARFLGG